jgi:nitrogen fixation protein
MRVNYAGQPHFPNRNDLEEPLLKVLIREFGGSINFTDNNWRLSWLRRLASPTPIEISPR